MKSLSTQLEVGSICIPPRIRMFRIFLYSSLRPLGTYNLNISLLGTEHILSQVHSGRKVLLDDRSRILYTFRFSIGSHYSLQSTFMTELGVFLLLSWLRCSLISTCVIIYSLGNNIAQHLIVKSWGDELMHQFFTGWLDDVIANSWNSPKVIHWYRDSICVYPR